MKRGDRFHPEGYEKLAEISPGIGVGNPAIVALEIYSNNSSHFFVVCRTDRQEWFVEEVVPYHDAKDDEELDGIYHFAVMLAVRFAFR
jgi:hypothetical protein